MNRYLGLDLGGTNIKAAVIAASDGMEEIITTDTAPTPAADGPDAVAEAMIDLGSSVRERVGALDGVGVGVPGLFDFGTGEIVFFTNLPGPWEGFPLRSRIADGLGVSTTLVNDARAFTFAESRLGAARGCRNVACITLGTGVGGGLYLNDELHFGAFGIGGELGHQMLLADGPVCGCGNPGCLEALARPPAVARRCGRATFQEVISDAEAGDPDANRELDWAIGWLGVGLANIVTMIGPERIVVGGGGAAAGDPLIDRIRDAVRERVTLVPPEHVDVVAATLGPTAGAVGAALAAVATPTRDDRFLAGEIPSAAMRRTEVTTGD